ncbi:MAG: cytochrome c-type biogenesis protein, heme chaperon CcmE [Candidatus Desulfovibrio kirbyi]|jgi:cytochrome c-type biogenesis protein CcmE|uniref:Cytochrome c-type biogenesis protein, heme chaperon CcmE n=1 Tax=Candidatus Desulfovibrio kirbyi TaxID=2696086 RepID=A0A6L2R5K0_9BACT|nr:MAG: cytochrome c-type biogenesis protein, heme chaperon CcmE [Candidatus Desulfovibrio kirbyi]
MAREKNTLVYVVALLLFLSGVGYLAYSAFTENSVYFLNVAEAKAVSPDKLTSARLFGSVAERGIEKHGMGVTFYLQDKDNAVQVIVVSYTGAVPDTFKPGAEVIVEGGMGAEGRFMARLLMTKCPSKYQKENRKT